MGPGFQAEGQDRTQAPGQAAGSQQGWPSFHAQWAGRQGSCHNLSLFLKDYLGSGMENR